MENYEEEEKTIRIGTLFRYLWKNIILFAAVFVGVFVIGLVYSFVVIKPTYKSSATFMVRVKDSNGSVDVVNSLRIIPTAVELVTSDLVIEPVAEEYGISKNSLSGMVSTKSEELNLTITVTVENQDKVLTGKLANSIVAKFIAESSNEDLKDLFEGNVTMLKEAQNGEYASPNKIVCIVVSGVAGLVIACIAVAVKELCSSKFRNRNQIENMLSTKVLGYFPKDVPIKKNGRAEEHDTKAKLLKRDIKSYEPYNYLLGNIKYSNLENPCKVIMLTSSKEDELKSTTAANLAACIAFNGQKVALIDMDMRKPVINKLFSVSGDNGIADYFAGNCKFEELIKPTEYGVDIITAGRKIINPMSVIGHKGLPELLNRLKETYDYIIVDTAPVLPCTDAAAIAPLCDGVLFNVAMQDVRKKEAVTAIKTLRMGGANIIGINVTKGTESKIDSGMSYYYYDNEYTMPEVIAEAAAAEDSKNTND